MVGLKWRVGALCALLCLMLVGLNLPQGSSVSAEDSGAKKPAVDKADAAANATPADPDDAADADSGKSSVPGQKKSAGSKKGAKPAAKGKSSKAKSKVQQAQKGKNPAGQAAAGLGVNLGLGAAADGAAVGAGGAGNMAGKAAQGNAAGREVAAAEGPDPKIVRKVMEIQDRNSAKLFQTKGVIGTSTGKDEDGNVVLRVYVTGAEKSDVPKTIEGVPVQVVTAGPVYPRWQNYSRKDRLPRAVPIGVSAFVDSSICATGTLGCRLRSRSGAVFGLSNNHVFGLENVALPGTKIFQPGSADANCNNSRNNIIGSLAQSIKIEFSLNAENLVDAAIMATTREQVNTTTLPDGYGVPRSNTVTPFLGQKVQKYGRTTGFTRGEVVGVNTTVVVAYDEGPARFIKQFDVVGINGGIPAFSAAGDSGSLVVDMERRPVGLLFAGGGFPIDITNCNLIDNVLSAFDGIEGLEVDDSPATTTGKVGITTPDD